MDILVRLAMEEDYDGLCELIDEVDELHRQNLPHIFQKPPGAIREREYFEGLLADAHVGIFIAEMQGELAGFAIAMIRDAPPIPILRPRRYAILDSIGVKSRWRHQGIGSRLMGEVHQWALAKGAREI